MHLNSLTELLIVANAYELAVICEFVTTAKALAVQMLLCNEGKEWYNKFGH